MPQQFQTLFKLVNSNEGHTRIRFRHALGITLTEPGFSKLTPKEQAAKLAESLNKPPAVPFLAADMVNRKPSTALVDVSEPIDVKNFEFDGYTADAQRWTVTIEGQTIPVTSAVDGDPSIRFSISEVVEALSRLPPLARESVKEVIVNSRQSSHNAFYEKTHGAGFQAFASCGADGVVNLFPSHHRPTIDVLTSSLVHESAHARSFQAWGHDEHDSPAWARWKEAGAKDVLLPSTYGARDLHEDAAETMVYYVESKGSPSHEMYRQMFPNRFALLDELYAAPVVPQPVAPLAALPMLPAVEPLPAVAQPLPLIEPLPPPPPPPVADTEKTDPSEALFRELLGPPHNHH